MTRRPITTMRYRHCSAHNLIPYKWQLFLSQCKSWDPIACTFEDQIRTYLWSHLCSCKHQNRHLVIGFSWLTALRCLWVHVINYDENEVRGRDRLPTLHDLNKQTISSSRAYASCSQLTTEPAACRKSECLNYIVLFLDLVVFYHTLDQMFVAFEHSKSWLDGGSWNPMCPDRCRELCKRALGSVSLLSRDWDRKGLNYKAESTEMKTS